MWPRNVVVAMSCFVLSTPLCTSAGFYASMVIGFSFQTANINTYESPVNVISDPVSSASTSNPTGPESGVESSSIVEPVEILPGGQLASDSNSIQ